MFGYFMDKIVRAAQMAERQVLKRSEVWAFHNEQMDRIENTLKELKEVVIQNQSKRIQKRK
jgi:hypothetical protein